MAKSDMSESPSGALEKFENSDNKIFGFGQFCPRSESMFSSFNLRLLIFSMRDHYCNGLQSMWGAQIFDKAKLLIF